MISLVFCDSNIRRPQRKRDPGRLSPREIAVVVIYALITVISIAVFWMVPGGMR